MTTYTFDLTELDVQVQLGTDPAFATYVPNPIGATNAEATMTGAEHGQSTVLKSFFRWKTDSVDLDDVAGNMESEDIEFDVSGGAASWPLIAVSTANVTAATSIDLSGDQTIDHDMVRHIAFKVTGGHRGADVFKNEVPLRDAVTALDATVKANVVLKLTTANIKLIGSRLLAQMLATDANGSDTARRQAVQAKIADRGANVFDWMTLPFLTDDKMAFVVRYSPKTDKPLESGTITERSYKVTLTLA